MLARTLLICTAAALLALTGCGEDESASALSAPLTYTRSGGMAGNTDVLTVQPDGKGTFEVDMGLKQDRAEIALTADERSRLAELVAAVDLGSIEDDTSTPIPDGYSYTVRYGSQAVDWQTEHEPESLGELNAELAELLEKYRP